MQKKWFRVAILFLILIISAVIFYWFGYKPSSDRKRCYQLAGYSKNNAIQADNNVEGYGMLTKRADYDQVFKDAYIDCLREKGLRG